MIYNYITTATTTQVWTGKTKRMLIKVNAALTGTIKVIDGITGTTANVATITNPIVGNQFEYWGLQTGIRIVTDVSCDITVSADMY